jgi:hypothetical protein
MPARSNFDNMSETPPAVQILPMNRHEDPEFKNYLDVGELQEKFFLRELPRRQGKYYYRESGLRKKPQPAVLFQSDAEIIASATLIDTEKFKEPEEHGGVFYKGALYFDVESIRAFDPVAWEKVSQIWRNLKKPGRVKYKVDPSCYAAFEMELKNVKRPDLVPPPFAPAHDVPRDELPIRLRMEVSRLVRDTRLSREVKAIHDNTCQVCGERLKLSETRSYAEGHHLRPLGKEHNGPDVKENIICVCPNCHVKLDYNVVRITPGMLKLKEGHSVKQEFIEYHNSHCQ